MIKQYINTHIALEECYAPCLDKHLGRTRKVAYD